MYVSIYMCLCISSIYVRACVIDGLTKGPEVLAEGKMFRHVMSGT